MKLFELERCYTSEYGDPEVARKDLFMAPSIEVVRKKVDKFDEYEWSCGKEGELFVHNKYEGYPSRFLYYMQIKEVVFEEPDEDGISVVKGNYI